MNDLNVRRLEMSNRVVEFLNANSIPFRKGSPGPQLVNEFKQAVTEIQNLTLAQDSELQESHTRSTSRGNARWALCDALDQITRTSRGMAVSIPELEGKFPPAHGLGDSKLHTRACAFAEYAKRYQKDFVNFGMAPDFIDDLNGKIETFERAVTIHAAGRSAHVATSKLVDDAMQSALNILVQLDPLVENYLIGDSALILKWENVRHTERAWVSRKPGQTTPESNTKPEADPSATAA